MNIKILTELIFFLLEKVDGSDLPLTIFPEIEL